MNEKGYLTRENITLQQFNVLLNTLATVQAGLREYQREDNGVPSVDRLSGETKLALEATLIQACARIDKALAEEDRWTLNRMRDVEEKLDATLKAQTDFFQSQKRFSEDQQRPCHMLKATLVKTNHGWCAYHGDLQFDESLITGIGDSPAEAMRQFDFSFFTKLSPEEAVTVTEVFPVKPKRKPKNT